VNGVPGRIALTYTSGSPTPAALVEAIAKCAGQISDTRKRPPSALLVRGARHFWIAGTEQGTTGEPVMRPGTGLLPRETLDVGPFGPVANLAVFHDNALPTTLGGGANQDVVVLLRCADALLLEDPAGPRFNANLASGLGGQLTVVLTWHHYALSIPDRYPSAIGTVQGTGLAIPAGF
jgi:hypothetical protein